MEYLPVWNLITPHQEVTRRLVLTPGDPGQLPITKIGGVPWWPDGTPRPHCSQGHAMSFLWQMLLRDVPQLGPDDPGLLSFHYCADCAGENYDLTIFTDWHSMPADNAGLIAEEVIASYTTQYSDRAEAPRIWDLGRLGIHLPDGWYEIEEFRCLGGDAYLFNEQDYPTFIHIPTSKLGGWPSWVQYDEWPLDAAGEPLVFAGQIDSVVGDNTIWASGGYAYLFVEAATAHPREAKWVMQS
ncbi:MAG TPA: DUF1963 domain-containing protein, partial [Armatimonadota bacterium]|nr:DUF1963 domain-containing protein [Armatimonadota bacterium]